MDHWLKPKDIVAVIALVGLFALKLAHVNSNVDVALALILGYYFAHRTDRTDPGL